MVKKPNAGAAINRRGGAINLYLHPGDDELIHKLRLHMMKQGHDASKSQVIRAAIRLAKPDDEFLEKCLAMIATDGRRKK
jgi:hypothetical protein